MTALTLERDTPMEGDHAVEDFIYVPVAASTKIYRGGLVALNASGYAAVPSALLNLIALGRAEQTVDNSGGADGALSVRVRRGLFRWDNSAGVDAITSADVGLPCYLVDDHTVARTSAMGTRSVAGRVHHVSTTGVTGVWVETGPDVDPELVDLYIPAGADLSSTGQYLFVALGSGGTVTVASSAGQDVIGICQNAPASGAIARVRIRGKSRVIASGTINPGVPIASDNTGKSKAAVTGRTDSTISSSTDALIGSFAMGRALTPGATSAQHSVLLHPMGAIPTTAA